MKINVSKHFVPETPIKTPECSEFEVSDNIVKKFHFVIPIAFLNVFCYCSAQFLLSLGFLKSP